MLENRIKEEIVYECVTKYERNRLLRKTANPFDRGLCVTSTAYITKYVIYKLSIKNIVCGM